MSAVLQIGFSVLLLLGNAFFVGAEFALVSVRRSQVQPLAEAGRFHHRAGGGRKRKDRRRAEEGRALASGPGHPQAIRDAQRFKY